MQTFLPYPDFARSAACLDNRRLGKQRVEAMQIRDALASLSNGLFPGWGNHPAVLMWQGYELALEDYLASCCVEWISRGFKNTIKHDFIAITITPWWLHDGRFHSAHRAALLAKDPVHYGQFGWTETPAINYWWPTKQEA